MLIINRSQRDGVTVDWKSIAAKEDDAAEWFELAEPFEQLQVCLNRSADNLIHVNSLEPLPDELTVTISLINDESNASVTLKQTNRNEAVEEGEMFLTTHQSVNVKDWLSEDGLLHYRVVINDNSVVGFNDKVTANHKHAFDMELATDFKLLVGGQVIKASKYVLMSQSDVFLAMLERWDEKDGNEVEIKDIEYEPMLAVVQAMYTGSIKLQNVEFALKVMTAADKYNVTAIKNACGEYIGKHLTTANVLSCLIEADKLVASSLTTECMKFLSKMDSDGLEELQESKEWKELQKYNLFTALFELFSQLVVNPTYSC